VQHLFVRNPHTGRIRMNLLASFLIVCVVQVCTFLISKNILGHNRYIEFIKLQYKASPFRWIVIFFGGLFLNIFLVYISIYTMVGYFCISFYQCYVLYNQRKMIINIVDHCRETNKSFDYILNSFYESLKKPGS
jgi:hypothetical protein